MSGARGAPGERLLVVNLAATSVNWALPGWAERRIVEETPAGWRAVFVRAPTVSDGDGDPRPSAEAKEAIRDAEAYFGFGMSPELFSAGPRLRWIHSAAVGIAALLFRELVESPVVLTNSAGIMGAPIAEHVIGGLLYLVRGFDAAVDLQRAGRWDKAPFVAPGAPIRELGRCRVLVVGAGGIGGAIAERLAAFGCRVTGIRRNPGRGAPPGFETVHGPDALERLLPESDVVILSAPHTPETRGLLTAARMDLLPRGAMIVNVARGALLDEDALVERLRDGRLRGAVLDVFSREPLPGDSPLWHLSQVLLTPHVSAVSPEGFWERGLALFLDNWRRFAAGEPLRNRVDKQAGY